jgi:hypothetical protein
MQESLVELLHDQPSLQNEVITEYRMKKSSWEFLNNTFFFIGDLVYRSIIALENPRQCSGIF